MGREDPDDLDASSAPPEPAADLAELARFPVSGSDPAKLDSKYDAEPGQRESMPESEIGADENNRAGAISGAGLGTDGRNPASDSGGLRQPDGELPDATSDPIGGNPYSGLEGSAGKIPAHQQVILDGYKAEAQAVRPGDFKAADAIAVKPEKYLVEIGQNEPKPDLISTNRSGVPGTELVWDTTKGEVVQVGSDVDPNPNDDSAGATYEGPPPLADPTEFVADYSSDYVATAPDPSVIDASDAVPDDEFFEE